MMNPLCYPIDTIPLKLPPLHTPHLLLHKCKSPFSQSLQFTHFTNLPQLSKPSFNLTPRRSQIQATAADRASSAAMSDIDMVQNKQGIYTPKPKKVVVLWDLDNKPPRGPPYEAATRLKQVAQKFGDVVDISAYANRHAFVHLPQWVLEERRERRRIDIFERKGLITPSDPYICSVCGRKCKTSLDLKKHFKQLHERERQKKLNRMKQLKGKKRQRYKERFISSNHKYNEAARSLITPKVGYGLASELRRAGVFVKTVEDKPQAADWALKRQMQHSMSRGIDWLILVSDDSDFSEMLRRAREANLGTVVVGDWEGVLGKHADLWVPWIGVENAEISEKDLVPMRRRRSEVFDRDDGFFSISGFDDGGGDSERNRNDGLLSVSGFDGGGGGDSERNLDSLMDELVAMRSDINEVKISAFSEGEEDDGDWERGKFNDDDDELSWDSDDEEREEDDGYF